MASKKATVKDRAQGQDRRLQLRHSDVPNRSGPPEGLPALRRDRDGTSLDDLRELARQQRLACAGSSGPVSPFSRFAVAPASDSDEISRVRPDGEPGWRAVHRARSEPARRPRPRRSSLPSGSRRCRTSTIPLAPEGTFDLAVGSAARCLLLDYWASWCAPCLKELPHLQALHATRSADGFVALAVNVDEAAATAASSAKTSRPDDDDRAQRPGGEDDARRALASDASRVRQAGAAARAVGRLLGSGSKRRSRRRSTSSWPTIRTERPATWPRSSPATGRSKRAGSAICPGTADGVVALSARRGRRARRRLRRRAAHLFDADGETVARAKTSSSAGRLLDFGLEADGSA